MRYTVTVEPEDQNADPNARLARTIVDADDKDAALDKAEAAYRRMYPNVGKLRVSVIRLRPRAK